MIQDVLSTHMINTQEVDPERDPERVEALYRQIDFFLQLSGDTRVRFCGGSYHSGTAPGKKLPYPMDDGGMVYVWRL